MPGMVFRRQARQALRSFQSAPGAELRHVAKVWNPRVVMGQHRAWEWLDFGEPDGLHAERVPRRSCSFYTAANASIRKAHK